MNNKKTRPSQNTKRAKNSTHRKSRFSRGKSNNKKRSFAKKGGHSGGRGGRKIPTFDPSKFINKNPVETNEEVYSSKHSFVDFSFNEKLENTLKAMKFMTPSPIQDQIIPEIMKGYDVIGLAETGTGKTAAFLLPLIEKTLHNQNRQTLILTPTRELAIQIDEEFRKFANGLNLFSTVCVGGMNIRPQIRSLQKANHFIIGTPGRVMDLIDRKLIKPQNLTTVVLDEADRMLDMGFINDMKKIISRTPKDRETLFFSATMTKGAEKVVNDFLNNPKRISVKKKDITNTIEQDIVKYTAHSKFDTLLLLLSKPGFNRVIIFGAMKHSVSNLAKKLSAKNIKAESIHGNKAHAQRQLALRKFKSGNARVLVATDVAARGIHVDNVTHVINYDLPQTFDDYVHRIGRTGRKDKKGIALTFVPGK